MFHLSDDRKKVVIKEARMISAINITSQCLKGTEKDRLRNIYADDLQACGIT
jgi:hypothetical protein